MVSKGFAFHDSDFKEQAQLTREALLIPCCQGHFPVNCKHYATKRFNCKALFEKKFLYSRFIFVNS
jgi:hypothetical protein